MTYEYGCTSCGEKWEQEQKITADPVRTCPHCKQDTAKRLICQQSGFVLKGRGWYADGYAS
jgi:putative FmdB family regulatory protein